MGSCGICPLLCPKSQDMACTSEPPVIVSQSGRNRRCLCSRPLHQYSISLLSTFSVQARQAREEGPSIRSWRGCGSGQGAGGLGHVCPSHTLLLVSVGKRGARCWAQGKPPETLLPAEVHGNRTGDERRGGARPLPTGLRDSGLGFGWLWYQLTEGSFAQFRWRSGTGSVSSPEPSVALALSS
jgi:hypothetical protein